jgi:trehalose 6-phosphate synthase
MKQIVLITAGVLAVISFLVIGFTYDQAADERVKLTSDLQYRTRVLADSLQQSVEPSYISNSTTTMKRIIDRFADRERLIGLGVYNSSAQSVATSSALPQNVSRLAIIETAMDSDDVANEFIESDGMSLYVLALPLRQDSTVVGALVVVQNAEYIDESVRSIWISSLWRLLVQLIIFGAAIFLLVRFVVYKPLLQLEELVRGARAGANVEHGAKHASFFRPLTSEISKMTKSLRQARLAASEEARMRLEKIDSPWTSERLKEFIKAYLKDRPIYVVSNREPYVHTKVKGNGTSWAVPASGVVTALEPVMEATGGLWIAHGGGSGDKETSDKDGKLRVPPDDPHYTLKRIWLSEKEVSGHYAGFSNEALWPLCHNAHTRPIFRQEDWTQYRKVNGKFAAALLAEIKDVQRPLILVQDYQFALLPAMIKASRPDAQVAIFWHIPWPSAEAFSICPWRKEVLEGMLGADLVGFHTQQYCNNFTDTVGKYIEAVIDLEQFTVTHKGHTSAIEAFPISTAFSRDEEDVEPDRSLLTNLGITTAHIGLGVDRLDYTKGILERLRGIEFLLDTHPEYLGEFTFLQIAPPSRESVEKYREYNEEVSAEAERINQKFKTNGWQPVVLEKRHYTHEQLRHLYRAADFCLVTSLHDGMNLVAKEYVAARTDEAGVLILSPFTGAARDLKQALIVNPYSAEQMAEAIHQSLVMTPTEQHRRMKQLRAAVRDYNVYRWSAELIKALANL